jgi:soluble lytic murein transglycosylase-like protein
MMALAQQPHGQRCLRLGQQGLWLGLALAVMMPVAARAEEDTRYAAVTQVAPDAAAEAVVEVPAETRPVRVKLPLPPERPARYGRSPTVAAEAAAADIPMPATAATPVITVVTVPDPAAEPEPTPGRRGRAARGETAPPSIRDMILRHAAAHGVPASLADAMVRVESRYNPAARNGVNLGLTQISHSTARSLGYSGSASGLMDANTNLQFGILYLARAYRLADGDTCRTVLKYQAGHRAVSMTAAARAYCSKVKTHVARTTLAKAP